MGNNMLLKPQRSGNSVSHIFDPRKQSPRGLSLSTVERLYSYYLLAVHSVEAGRTHISSAQLARYMDIGDTQIRKDMAAIGLLGQPRHGYPLPETIGALRQAMGIDQRHPAVLCGVGNLGTALLEYSRFSEFGFSMVGAFDIRKEVIGQQVGSVEVLHVAKMQSLIRRQHAEIGVIAVNVWAAQMICDQMLEAGIRAIWNFAPLHLNAPPGVLVMNEDFAGSLSVISHYLRRAD
jgi:redox-sensing transcriptional repressor